MKTRTAILTILRALGLGAPAQAARVAVVPQPGDQPPRVEFTARSGEINNVRVSYEGSAFVFSDRVAVSPGPGCDQGASAMVARCPTLSNTPLRVDLGNKSDHYTATPGEVSALTTITYPQSAITAPTHVEGGPGSDTIGGGLGRDTLLGGSGDESLSGPTPDNSADELFGGEGTDTAVAVGRNARGPRSLLLSLDDQPNDALWGLPYEGDNLHSDNENVVSGPGSDTIVPRFSGGTVRAGAGNDTIELDNGWGHVVHGETGNDIASYVGMPGGARASLDGRPNDGPNDDRLPFPVATGNLLTIEDITGSAFNDVIEGGTGANHLDGRGGDDQVDGRAGPDQLVGGDGDDHLVGFDQAQFFSRDRLDCGEGRDSAVFDRLDSLNPDCELDYGAVMPLELELATQIEVFAASRSFVLPFECLLGPDCIGILRVTASVRPVDARAITAASKRVTIAKHSYRVRGGTQMRLRLRLTRTGRRLLRRVARRRPARRALRVRLSSTTKPPSGYRPSTARRTIRLVVKRGRAPAGKP